MKYKFIFYALFSVFLAEPLFGQTLTLDAFLASVKQNHPFFRQEGFNPEIERKAQEAFLGKEDWVFSGQPYTQYEKTATTDPFMGSSVTSFGAAAKLEKLFLHTGARFSLDWLYNYQMQKLPEEAKAFNIPTNNFYQKLTARYSLPLLQNQNGTLDRLEYDLKGFDVNLSEIKILENKENFLLEASNKFIEWVIMNEQFNIASNELKLNEQQLAYTKRKFAANLVTKADVLGANDAVTNSRQTVQFLDGERKAIQAYLSVLTNSKKVLSSQPEYNLYELDRLQSADSLSSHLTANSRLLQVLFQQAKQLRRVNEGYQDSQKPQLYLNLSAGFQKNRTQFSNTIVPNKPNASISLSFEVPLGNHTATANVEKSELQLLQLTEAINTTKIELDASLRQLVVQLQTMQSVLALNQEQINSAKARTLEERKLYRQGRGSLNFVLLSRTNEQNARFTYAQNAGKYHALLLQLKALTDHLLEEGNN